MGTLSKPAIGVLDLATGAANAVRENSRSAPAKGRAARVLQGPGGLLSVARRRRPVRPGSTRSTGGGSRSSRSGSSSCQRSRSG